MFDGIFDEPHENPLRLIRHPPVGVIKAVWLR